MKKKKKPAGNWERTQWIIICKAGFWLFLNEVCPGKYWDVNWEVNVALYICKTLEMWSLERMSDYG